MSGLFITLLLWLAGSIILLWQASILTLRHRVVPPFLPFFAGVIVMDATAAFIYYGAWATSMWVIVRFLWLISFLLFFGVWFRAIRINLAKK